MDEIVDLVYALRVVQYFQVAVAVVAVYDHITTFDVEVELIWKKEWSMIKFLFLTGRYLGEFVATSTAIDALLELGRTSEWNTVDVGVRHTLSNCIDTEITATLSGNTFYLIQAWGGVFIIWSMQGILQYRIFAMYEHSRKIIIFIVTCFICEALAMALFMGLTYKKTNLTTESIPGVFICAPTTIPHSFYLFWVPIICFESLLFGMASYIGIQWHRNDILRITPGGNPGLFYLMLRDSISFPFLTLSIYIVNLIIWYTLPPHWMEAVEAFAEVAACVVGCRLILNLREAYYLPFGQEVSTLVSMFDLGIAFTADVEQG